ncbi:hypothetical protein GYMLUDRAFT_416289 [Collybiopsis luxurians FD-317 M1]|nr:hypothetical protein GYMLUDRAFT_416289 [Collybiopsis luxurians FD-317 M1]
MRRGNLGTGEAMDVSANGLVLIESGILLAGLIGVLDLRYRRGESSGYKERTRIIHPLSKNRSVTHNVK